MRLKQFKGNSNTTKIETTGYSCRPYPTGCSKEILIQQRLKPSAVWYLVVVIKGSKEILIQQRLKPYSPYTYKHEVLSSKEILIQQRLKLV